MAFGRQQTINLSPTQIPQEDFGDIFRGIAEGAKVLIDDKRNAVRTSLANKKQKLEEDRLASQDRTRKAQELLAKTQAEIAGSKPQVVDRVEGFDDEGRYGTTTSIFNPKTKQVEKTFTESISPLDKVMAGRTGAGEKPTKTIYSPDGQEFNVTPSQVPFYQKAGWSITKPTTSSTAVQEQRREAEARGELVSDIMKKTDKGIIFSDEFTKDQSNLLDATIANITKNLPKNEQKKFANQSEEQIFSDVNDYLIRTQGKKFVRDPLSSILPAGKKGWTLVPALPTFNTGVQGAVGNLGGL